MGFDEKFLSATIIPAQQNFFMVYDYKESKEIIKGEPVIAWQIKTVQVKGEENDGEIFSQVTPLVLDGVPAENWIGVQNPDKTVTVAFECDYASLEALQKERYPETASAQSDLQYHSSVGAGI